MFKYNVQNIENYGPYDHGKKVKITGTAVNECQNFSDLG
jgi:hypothetical protein